MHASDLWITDDPPLLRQSTLYKPSQVFDGQPGRAHSRRQGSHASPRPWNRPRQAKRQDALALLAASRRKCLQLRQLARIRQRPPPEILSLARLPISPLPLLHVAALGLENAHRSLPKAAATHARLPSEKRNWLSAVRLRARRARQRFWPRASCSANRPRHSSASVS